MGDGGGERTISSCASVVITGGMCVFLFGEKILTKYSHR